MKLGHLKGTEKAFLSSHFDQRLVKSYASQKAHRGSCSLPRARAGRDANRHATSEGSIGTQRAGSERIPPQQIVAFIVFNLDA